MMNNGEDKREKDLPCLQKVSVFIIGGLEKAFGNLGLKIATYPMRFILGCFILSSLTGIGLLAFREENQQDKLWVPEEAKVRDNKAWVERNFPSRTIFETIIGTSDNVIQARQIQALFDIYQESLTLQTSSGIMLTDVCVKAGSQCKISGILEVWSFDNATIQALTDAQVLIDIKATTTSPVYGNEIDMTNYLGDITYDGNGDIIGAKAARINWLTEGNDTMIDDTESWESKFISMGKRGHADLSRVYVIAGRSWVDESQRAIQSDVLSLSIGYFLVILFVMFVLGNFNFLEQRAWLTFGGLICIGLSVLISIGLSSAFQQFYGPIQSVLPFLLLGLGVDDMFVIMGALANLSPEEREYDIPQKVSAVLSHAGVSITVTSLTDFVAFMIGATTIIPALRSFCIYAGIGIIALYLLQAMFFTACLTIDLRRLKDNRDACCCMIKHGENYRPNDCSQRQMIPDFFKKVLAPLATKLPFKIIVLLSAAGVLGVNIYGFSNLENYFDRNLFLPTGSYARIFIDAEEKYFPSNGDPGHIYCGQISYYTHKSELESLDTLMGQSTSIVNGTTDSWFIALTNWLSTETDADVVAKLDVSKYPTTEDNFLNLTYRLTTSEAPRTSSYIRFVSSSDLTIQASRFPLMHILTDSAADEIAVMDDIYEIVEDAGFSSSECFPYSFVYLTWETNKIIREELYRNIGLAMLCVFLVSLILIANIVTSIFVFLCVIATLINVAGTMYFWGLTIDTVTSVILILSVGLAVDYSAHIGHMFMSVRGTKQERVKETVGVMGPPVFYGGFSTFLAFVLLANSDSYIFKTFFQLNFLTVLYGLFHGLIVLPVLLSFLGPKAYPNATITYKNQSRQNKENNDIKGVENPALEQDDVSKTNPLGSQQNGGKNLTNQNGVSEPQSESTNNLSKDKTIKMTNLSTLPPVGNGNKNNFDSQSSFNGSSHSSNSPPPTYTTEDENNKLSTIDP